MIHFRCPFLSNQIEINKNTIAELKLTVNKYFGFGSVIMGKINIEPNQPAETLENQPDKTKNILELIFGSLIIIINLTRIRRCLKYVKIFR